MSWHGYLGFENINLTDSQRNKFIKSLKSLGKFFDSQPSKNNQFRSDLFDTKAIIETEFADDDVSLSSLKSYLSNVFDIDPSSIDHAHISNQYGDVFILSRLGIERIKIILFGGISSTWEDSRLSAANYLKTTLLEWEEPDPIEELPELSLDSAPPKKEKSAPFRDRLSDSLILLSNFFRR